MFHYTATYKQHKYFHRCESDTAYHVIVAFTNMVGAALSIPHTGADDVSDRCIWLEKAYN